MIYSELLPVVWSLIVLLVVLIVGRKISDDVKPVVTSVVSGLSSHATKNATSYAFGFLLASAASLQALGDEASKLGWVYVGAICKVLQPGIVAIIGLIARSNTQQQPTKTGTTQAPFPPNQ